ncbi:MAG: glycoside hydrolase, partial [Chloroflexus sp.]
MRISTIITGMMYVGALAIAGFLLWQTVQLSSSLVALSANAPTSTVAVIPTATAAPLLVLPTPVPPTPLPTIAPPQPETVGYHPKSGRYIAVWLPPNFAGDARESFFANVDIIDDISPFWYTTDASGRLYGQRDDDLVRIAHENNARIIPSIHNVGNPGAV